MTTQSNKIFELYEHAENADVGDFSKWGLAFLGKDLSYDSCNLVSFLPDGKGSLAVGAHIGWNIDAMAKIKLRQEMLSQEHFDPVKGLQSEDVLLKKLFSEHKQIHTIHVPNTKKSNLIEYAKKTEATNALGLSIKHGNGLILFSGWRKGESDHFKENDLYNAEQILPHFLKAYQINRKLAVHPLLDKANKSLILATSSGDIIHYDEAAVYHIRQTFPFWLSGRIPAEMLEDIKKKGHYQNQNVSVRLIEKKGTILKLEVSKSRPHTLTQAEIKVVELLVLHGSAKKVALTLNVSVNTVRNQVSSIYKKLGINSKTELVKIYSDL